MKRRSASCLCCILVAWAYATQAADADAFLRALAAAHRIPEAAISPDGQKVAWTEGSPSRPLGRSGAALFVVDLAAVSSPRQLVGDRGSKGSLEIRHIAWSPDSRQLAFLSDLSGGDQAQLFVISAAGGAAQRMTSGKGYLAHPLWSPDGRSVAVLFTENARADARPTAAKRPEVGVVEERLDVQRIAVVDIATRRLKAASPPALYVHEYDWAPDGRRFVAVAAPPPGDDGWYVSELYTVDAVSTEAASVYKPERQIGCPRWSPDGRSLAFIMGLMSDEGVIGGDIFVIPVAGGDARNLTPGREASPSWLAWLPTSREILFAENVDGESALASVDVDGRSARTIWRGAEQLGAGAGVAGPALSLASDGKTAAAIRESFTKPPEVWAGPVGAWQPVTRANERVETPWGRAESLSWRSDGLEIQGWLVHPHEETAGRLHPMIVNVHGGPAGTVVPAWPSATSALALASEGNFVFLPNPRGSHGRGQDFVRANVKDFGGGDLRDILAGVDEVVRTRPVDEARLGIRGWSYGGFMTMWTVTQTRRFRAAVAGAGIANWQSYYGQNGIARWMLPYFEASVYDDPAVYARSSPINFIGNVRTPTLMLVGEGDIECPPPQSYEFWRALKARGIATQLVVYPGEGHGIVKPENRLDLVSRTAAWFRDHLR